VRILVTGASGFIGGYLVRALSGEHEVWAGVRRGKVVDGAEGSVELDLEQVEELGELVREVRPEAIVHAAAMVDADRCGREPEATWRVNVAASEALARAASSLRAGFVFTSTDLVFDGSKPMATEEDAPAPLSAYGRSKLDAERAVLAAAPGGVVFRLALVYGVGLSRPAGFMERLVAGALEGRPARLFVDQYRTPLYVEDIPAAVLAALERRVSGVFHLSGGVRISRYDFGLLAAGVFGFSERLCERASLRELPGAPRPADCSLSPRKAMEALDWRPLDPRRGLLAMRRRWEELRG